MPHVDTGIGRACKQSSNAVNVLHPSVHSTLSNRQLAHVLLLVRRVWFFVAIQVSCSVRAPSVQRQAGLLLGQLLQLHCAARARLLYSQHQMCNACSSQHHANQSCPESD